MPHSFKPARISVLFVAACAVAGALAAASPASAQQEAGAGAEPEGSAASYIRNIALAEVVFLGASYLAAESPELFGGTVLVLGSTLKSQDRTTAGRIAEIASAVVIGGVNAFVLSDSDEYNRDDIIENNMLLWNLGMATVIVAEVLGRRSAKRRQRQKEEEAKGAEFSALPLPGGAMLTFRYDF